MPLLIILSMASALVCYLIARSRSADRRYWTVLGLCLGPLAIPFAFFAGPVGPGPAGRRQSAYTDAGNEPASDEDRESPDDGRRS